MAARDRGDDDKIVGGGGELVAHSKVGASQGLSPADAPAAMAHHDIDDENSTPMAKTKEPSVVIRLSQSQPMPSA
jgi:hypothetical protein